MYILYDTVASSYTFIILAMGCFFSPQVEATLVEWKLLTPRNAICTQLEHNWASFGPDWPSFE